MFVFNNASRLGVQRQRRRGRRGRRGGGGEEKGWEKRQRGNNIRPVYSAIRGMMPEEQCTLSSTDTNFVKKTLQEMNTSKC